MAADGLDDAGEVHAGDAVAGAAQPVAEADRVRQAGHQVPDAGVDAGGADPDEHVVVADPGRVDVPQFPPFCRAVAVLDDGFHEPSWGYWNTSVRGTSNTAAIWKAISSDGE